MKIEQIDLQAFGHFTRQRLVLGDAANLHLICGPNEAGKTTLWRAINGALFGTAGAPIHSLCAGMCSPFMTTVSGPSRA